MTLTMRDSVSAAAIPAGGTDIAAGYLNGSFADWTALVARFPGVPKVAIDVNGSAPGAEARDWETGDKGGSLEQWVIQHNMLTGAKDAVVYCNRSTIAEVRHLTGTQILGKDYWLWIATLDGSVYGPSQLSGVIACQNLGAAQTGGNFDQSIVWDTPAVWWTSGLLAPVKPSAGNTPPSAAWTYGPVTNLALVGAGPDSVKFSFTAGTQVNGGLAKFQVAVCKGSVLGQNLCTYPRYIDFTATGVYTQQFGGLAPATEYILAVRGMAADGSHSSGWSQFTFTTAPAA